MPDLPHRCSFHILNQDMHWYANQEMREFTECLSAATHYVAVEVPAQDGFAGEQYINLCASHEETVRTSMGWKWSRPKAASSAT